MGSPRVCDGKGVEEGGGAGVVGRGREDGAGAVRRLLEFSTQLCTRGSRHATTTEGEIVWEQALWNDRHYHMKV